MADPDVEWEQRRLCADGACIGVAGADGRCKVCGKLVPDAGGPFRATPLDAERDSDDSDDDDSDGSDDGDGDDAELSGGSDEVKVAIEAGAAAGVDFEDERELCPDGACIGLIGDDGACKVCGKRRS